MVKDNSKSRKRIFILISVAVLLIAGSLITIAGLSEDGPVFSDYMHTVKQGPLKISVSTGGTIQAREKIIIKSELEGKGSTVLSLIDEGTKVKKGDLLIEMDASTLIEKKLDQELKVRNAEASYINGRENLAVVENQVKSNIKKAQIAYDFAVQDLQKYIDGEYPNQLKESESNIMLKQEEATRAEEELKWSQKLYAEKFISESELEADELALKKKQLDLELAQSNLELLKNYTHKINLAQLESDVHQAKMALERTRLKAGADIIQAESNLKAKESELNRQKDRFANYEEQITKAKIYSPADGTIIYSSSVANSGGGGKGGGRSSSTQPLAEGSSVRERQDLFQLPAGSGMDVEVGIYEASLDKVMVGLPVDISVEMLPGEVFTGRVKSIGLLPDAASAFMNSDQKVYKTLISLDDTDSLSLLRTGMNCTTEIIAGHYKKVTYIPAQAILLVNGKHTVYVVKNGVLEPRNVELGMGSDSQVIIENGLEAGEVITLEPPLNSGTVQTASIKMPDDTV